MPQLNVTVKGATQVWASPDGQRKIHEVVMEWEGKAVKAKTYSDAIATVGWSGTVETYEKQGRNGIESFVKQPPKEGGYSGSGSGGYSGNRGAKPQDAFTMFLAYAKDIAVALINSKDYNAAKLAEIVNDVGLAGQQLFELRPDAPKPGEKLDEVITEMPEGPVDLSLVDKVFNLDGEQEPETPWKT